MRTPQRVPQELTAGPFTLGRARELGVSEGTLRNKRFESLGRGIRTTTTAGLDLRTLAAPFVEVNEQCALSHHTAVQLYGLPRRSAADDAELMVHVTRPAGASHLARPHVLVHRAKLLPGEVVTTDGLPMTSPARTWLDMAGQLTLDELVALGDACVRVPRPEFEGRDAPFCSLEDLDRVILGHRGKRGLRRAKEARQLIRVGADSPKETELRLALLRAGLPEPELNRPVLDEFGCRLFQPDVGFPGFEVGVEYDGRVHDTALQSERDIGRAEKYARAGWTEVRISAKHMKNDANEAVVKVKSALIQAGWRP